jgi:hypothetical protein
LHLFSGAGVLSDVDMGVRELAVEASALQVEA